MPSGIRVITALAAVALIVLAAAAGPERDALAAAGVEKTTAGVLGHLRAIAPTAAAKKRVRVLVEQLGADSFRERRAAEKELRRLALTARAAVTEASRSEDPEIKLRARRILRQMDAGRPLEVLRAGLRLLVEKAPGEGGAVVLQVLPLCGGDMIFPLACDALKACLTPADKDLLVKALSDPNVLVRRAAVICLEGDNAAVLRPSLKDKDERVRYLAAVAVLNLKDRAGLAPLAALLRSEDERIRQDALLALQAATGDESDTRADVAAAAKWQAWVKEKGAAAELKLPVEPALGAELIGSKWRITFDDVTDLKPYVFTLLPGGEYSYPGASDTKKHVWSVRGSRITFSVNNAYATYTGVIRRRDYMSGEARNIKNKTWTWEARRQK